MTTKSAKILEVATAELKQGKATRGHAVLIALAEKGAVFPTGRRHHGQIEWMENEELSRDAVDASWSSSATSRRQVGEH